MKKLLIGFLVLASGSSFAGVNVRCQSVNSSYDIEFGRKTISTKEIGSNSKTAVWSIYDPGIYSYYALDAKGPSDGNTRQIDGIRFDIEDGIKLSRIVSNTQFEMRISFFWWDIDADYSALYSDQVYSCKKL